MPPPVQLFVFNLDRHRYALPVDSIWRVVRMVAVTPLPKAPPIVLGVVNLEGDLVPVWDVRQRFRLPPRAPRPSDYLLLARTSRRTVALPVDGIDGFRECSGDVIQPLTELARGTDYVAGVAKLPGEDLILIHDVETFLDASEAEALETAVKEAS